MRFFPRTSSLPRNSPGQGGLVIYLLLFPPLLEDGEGMRMSFFPHGRAIFTVLFPFPPSPCTPITSKLHVFLSTSPFEIPLSKEFSQVKMDFLEALPFLGRLLSPCFHSVSLPCLYVGTGFFFCFSYCSPFRPTDRRFHVFLYVSLSLLGASSVPFSYNGPRSPPALPPFPTHFWGGPFGPFAPVLACAFCKAVPCPIKRMWGLTSIFLWNSPPLGQVASRRPCVFFRVGVFSASFFSLRRQRCAFSFHPTERGCSVLWDRRGAQKRLAPLLCLLVATLFDPLSPPQVPHPRGSCCVLFLSASDLVDKDRKD